MKQCPKCQRTFSDDTLSFCLSDGALLSAPYDHPSTQRNLAHSTNPHDTLIVPSVSRHHLPTETMEPLETPTLRPSRAPTLPNSQAPTLKMELVRPRSRIKLITGAMILLVAAAAVVWFVKFRPAAATTADPAALEKYSEQLRSKRDAWLDHAFIGQGTAGGMKESPSAADNTQQAWATAQVLVGAYSTDRDLPQLAPRLKNGFAYLKALRRTTPADGWNLYGNENPYTLTEINAWVTLAHIMSLDGKTKIWNDAERQDLLVQIDRDLAELKLRQSDTGGFRPIRDDQPSFTRTYPTIMALWALADAKRSPTIGPKIGAQYDDAIRKGINWLFGSYKAGQGWVPNPNRVGQTAKFQGLNAQTLLVLSRLEAMPEFAFLKSDPTYKMAKSDFLAAKQITEWNADENNSSVPDADVRYPGTEFTAEGSTFLWFPWTLAELTMLTHDATLSDTDRATAAQLRFDILNHNAAKLDNYVETANLSYIFAENLVGVSVFLQNN
jgi:hypothetical protein